MRLKVHAYTVLAGRKPQWRFQEKWIGDEFSIPERNPHSAKFHQAVRWCAFTLTHTQYDLI